METSSIKIRKARDEDFDQIFRIWLENQKYAIARNDNINSNRLKTHFKKLFKLEAPCFFFIVAINENREIIGWQSCLPFENNPLLYFEQGESSTYVKKSYWGKGVGKKLLIAIMEMLPQTTIKWFFGKAITANQQIIDLGIKLGWEPIGIIPQSLKNEIVPETMLLVYNVPEQKLRADS